jgi:hypothetical protein
MGILVSPILPLYGIRMKSFFPKKREWISVSIRDWEEKVSRKQDVMKIESMSIVIVRERDQYFLFSLENREINKQMEAMTDSVRKIAFSSCPLFVRIVLYTLYITTPFLYSQFLNEQSHALMLQDHLTYRFSYYLEENKRTLKMYESQMEEWIHVFMENCVEFTLDSERYMGTELYPMFQSERDKERKIRVPKGSEKNIFFFLLWLMKNSPNLDNFYEMREVPSFLNHKGQFPKIKNQLIQRCNETYTYLNLYRYEILSGPLETLKLEPDVFYYYRNIYLPWEFFHVPRLVYRTLSFIKGIEILMSYSFIQSSKIYFFDVKKKVLAAFLLEQKEIEDVRQERNLPSFYLYAISKNDFLFFVSI